MSQGVSIKKILLEKELADSISEKCEIILQQHSAIQELEAKLAAKDAEIEKLKNEEG